MPCAVNVVSFNNKPKQYIYFINVMIIELYNHNITILCVECTTGYYGVTCLNRCGHCFGLDVCFHTNGSCPGKCCDGFRGEKCTDRELYIFSKMENILLIY